MSHSSQRPSDPAYYVEDCWISTLAHPKFFLQLFQLIDVNFGMLCIMSHDAQAHPDLETMLATFSNSACFAWLN